MKRVKFSVQNTETKESLHLQTGFSWSVCLFYWLGIPFFKRKLLFLAFLCLIFTLYYITHLFKAFGAISIELANLNTLDLNLIHAVYSKYLNPKKELLINIILAIPSVPFAKKVDKWAANNLIKQGWVLNLDKLTNEEKKLVISYLND